MGGDDDSWAVVVAADVFVTVTVGATSILRFLVGVVVGETMARAAAAPSVDKRGEEEGSEEDEKESEWSSWRLRGRPRRFFGRSMAAGIFDPES